MIHVRAESKTVQADICVIGSGAGGSAAAYALAKAGKRVVLLEGGKFLKPSDFNQREEDMYPQLFFDSGGRRTRDLTVRILHGHGIGGSTVHNINLCKRAPDSLLESWALPGLSPRDLAPIYDQVEALLAVKPIDPSQMNSANRLFQKGVEALKYKGGLLSHNRVGCIGSGFCELGCAYDAKMNAMRVLIPEAVRAGAEVYANARVRRLEWDGRRVLRAHTDTVVVEAQRFIVSGGAIETPALLQRSKIPDPHRLIGSRLHLHPGVAAAGVFEEKVESWKGIPQSYECTEFLSFDHEKDKRTWLVLGTAHPAGAASIAPGFGKDLHAMMRDYPNLLAVSAMVHDESSGTVSAKGDDAVTVDYSLTDGDCRQMALGLREAARILFAAGAKKVLLPFRNPIWLDSASAVDSTRFEFTQKSMDIVSVHPMSSVWMGTDPKTSCTDPTGRLHTMDNLFVADTSLYPTSIGIPPQISTYAMGFHVAKR